MILKNLYWIFLFIFCSSFAQDTIYKADGTRAAINGESVKIDLRRKQLQYVNKGETVVQKIALKNLNKVSYNGKRFEMLKIGSKLKGYYVLAQHDGLTLAAFNKQVTTNSGGFNQKYVYHEVAIIDKNKTVERVSFTENNDDKNIKKRVKTKQMIEMYFGNCIEVAERLASFSETGNTALIGSDVVAYLKQAPYLLCP